jgi:hypothetical protein
VYECIVFSAWKGVSSACNVFKFATMRSKTHSFEMLVFILISSSQENIIFRFQWNKTRYLDFIPFYCISSSNITELMKTLKLTHNATTANNFFQKIIEWQPHSSGMTKWTGGLRILSHTSEVIPLQKKCLFPNQSQVTNKITWTSLWDNFTLLSIGSHNYLQILRTFVVASPEITFSSVLLYR